MERRERTRRITYSAVATAIAVVAVLLSNYTPMRIVPLIFASLAIYIACIRCGIVFGLITAAAAVLIAFALGGVGTTFLFLCVAFVPYALVAFFMRKLSYRVVWQAIVRIAVSAALFAGAFTAMAFLTDCVAGTSLMTIIEKVGMVWAILLVTLAALPVDLFFSFGAERIVKLLK